MDQPKKRLIFFAEFYIYIRRKTHAAVVLLRPSSKATVKKK
jgi:hypothetical protein